MVYKSREEFRTLGFIHRWNAVATLILLVSGLLLYAEPLRGALAPVRVPLKYVHIWSGVLLALWALHRLPDWAPFLVRAGLQWGRRLNAWLTAAWLAGWTGTGLLMWLRGTVPFEVSNLAVTLHDWLTWLAVPWVTLHIAFRLERVRRLDERGALSMGDWLTAPATRRAVLWAGFAALGGVLLGRWFRPAPTGLDSDGLPPVDPATLAGGGMKGRFRLYFVNNVIPTFDPAAWKLTVGSRSYTWEQFLALPQVEYVRNFHCVTGWSVFDITWRGVRVKDLIADAGLPPSEALVFHAGDTEYTDSLTWAQAQDDDTILAFEMDGHPLPQLQGGPVRLFVPSMYGYKSVKWVERITQTGDSGYLGYWEERGYAVDAYLERGEPVSGSQPGADGEPAWKKKATP